MYKKTITYTDYDGNERTENLYFHVKKSQIIEMELRTPGGLRKKIEEIIAVNDIAGLIDTMNAFMRMAYGVKSEDGRRFIQKTPEGRSLFDEFVETEAYEKYMDMLLDDTGEEAARLVNGAIPEELNLSQEQIEEEAKKLGLKAPTAVTKES